MAQQFADGVAETVDGMDREAAVEALVAADPERDPDRVRAALTHVTDDDGVVSQAIVEDALTDAAMVAQTAETRAELLESDFADAREAAAEAPEFDLVETRLAAFASSVDEVDEAARDLTADLAPLRAHRDDPAAIYTVAQGCRDVTESAQTVTRQASDLRNDLDCFEHWLTTHDYRVDELETDVDTLGEFVEALAADAASVAASATGGDGDASAWADATVRHRTARCLVADVRAEAETLRAWADADEEPLDDLDAVDERIDALAATVAAVGERLDAAQEDLAIAAYDGIVTEFEATADSVSPPVAWGALQTHLESAQERLDAAVEN